MRFLKEIINLKLKLPGNFRYKIGEPNSRKGTRTLSIVYQIGFFQSKIFKFTFYERPKNMQEDRIRMYRLYRTAKNPFNN